LYSKGDSIAFHWAFVRVISKLPSAAEARDVPKPNAAKPAIVK
jgi:hypothetical protein